MKRFASFALVAAMAIRCAFNASAQDKVVREIVETGTTGNRTMGHAGSIFSSEPVGLF